MINKPKFFWTPKDKSPEEMTNDEALKLKDATGDNAVSLALNGHVETCDGDIYVVNNKKSLFRWP